MELKELLFRKVSHWVISVLKGNTHRMVSGSDGNFNPMNLCSRCYRLINLSNENIVIPIFHTKTNCLPSLHSLFAFLYAALFIRRKL